MAETSESHTLKELQLRRLDDQYSSLSGLLRDLDEGAWDRRPSNGKWSAQQHLAHLARYHRIFLDRVNRILRESDPVLDRYSAEADSEWQEWQSLEHVEIVRRLDSLRAEVSRQLAEAPAEAFGRIGIHPRFGQLTLADWLEFFLIHEGHHMYCMYRARWD